MSNKALLILASGILTGIAFDIPVLSVLAWISLVPLFIALEHLTQKQTVLYGLMFGIIYHGVAIFWIGNVSVLGLFVLLLYLSIYTVIALLMCRIFLQHALAILIIPALWVCVEFLKEHIWCGFGWVNLGYSQYNALSLIQIADIGGAKIISFLVVMNNMLLFSIMTRKKQVVMQCTLTGIVLLGSFLYSTYRMTSLRPHASIKVSVVQPNVAEQEKNNPATAPAVIKTLRLLAGQAQDGALVVFPEAAWPVLVRYEEMFLVREFAKAVKKDMLIGAVIQEQHGFFNAALHITAQGELRNIYRKIRLVPFGEYVPLRRFLSFIEVLNTLGDMNRGLEFTLFDHRGKKFSSLICFEDVLPGFVSRFAAGSDFLVNITNDEWFRGEPQAHQHLGILIFRAIENRRSMVRCANTGISGWISYTGKKTLLRSNAQSVFIQGVETYDLPLNRENSLYNKWGEFFSLICALIVAAAIGQRYCSTAKKS